MATKSTVKMPDIIIDDAELEKFRVFPEIEEDTDMIDGPDDASGGEGYVYILQECADSAMVGKEDEATGYFKIGSTFDIKKVKSEFQAGNVRPMYFLLYPLKWPVSNPENAKRAVMKAVSKYAVSLGGGKEWFCVQPENIEDFLERFDTAIEYCKLDNR